MTVFDYKAINEQGKEVTGTIDAINRDVAISGLQRRGLIIAEVVSSEKVPFFERSFASFRGVPARDVVILSRQISTLFEAQVSALKVFTLLGSETENEVLREALNDVAQDLKGGSSIGKALSKHPKIFSDFYVNMIHVGEESGKLQDIFLQLADYMDRNYELSSKARNALIYPAFVIATFVVVMILMLTTVIPRISTILEESGQEIPIYTKIVLGMSNFFVNYGIFLLILAIVGGFFLIKYTRSKKGKKGLSRFKLNIPYVGNLYKKLYLSRIADNLQTMLLAGVPTIKAIESTGNAVGNAVYQQILEDAQERVRGGSSLSDSLSGHDEIPNIVVQMIKVGEESGELGSILATLSHFYRREVNNAVDTLVDLIEPAMIVLLGAGVGFLLASVLIPIYNISAGF